MIWLMQVPPAILGSLFVVVLVGFSVFGLIVFRRAVSHTRLEEANAASGQVFQLAGVLYAVLVAFVVVVVWEQFRDAQEATHSEAIAVADLIRDSEALPAQARPQIRKELIAYTQDVVNDEFPRMRRGEAIEEQSEQMTRVWASYLHVEPVTRAEISFYDESIHRLDDLGTSRKVRVASSQAEIPGELWVLLIGGGAIVMMFTFMFGTQDMVVQASGVALTSALMAFAFYLIFTLEHPFVGALSVSPDAYVRVLAHWS